jgi:hypothetical protein
MTRAAGVGSDPGTAELTRPQGVVSMSDIRWFRRSRAAAAAAGRSPRDGEPARPSHGGVRSPRRSALAPSPSGVWQHRSAAARWLKSAAASDGAMKNDPRDTLTTAAPRATPPTNAATTYTQSSARRHGTRHRPPIHAGRQVRDERYGEAPSGSSFDCEPSQTHSLEGDPDDLLSRPQRVEARHLDLVVSCAYS